MINRASVAKRVGDWVREGQAGHPCSRLRLVRREGESILPIDAWAVSSETDVERLMDQIDEAATTASGSDDFPFRLLAHFGGSESWTGMIDVRVTSTMRDQGNALALAQVPWGGMSRRNDGQEMQIAAPAFGGGLGGGGGLGAASGAQELANVCNRTSELNERLTAMIVGMAERSIQTYEAKSKRLDEHADRYLQRHLETVVTLEEMASSKHERDMEILGESEKSKMRFKALNEVLGMLPFFASRLLGKSMPGTTGEKSPEVTILRNIFKSVSENDLPELAEFMMTKISLSPTDAAVLMKIFEDAQKEKLAEAKAEASSTKRNGAVASAAKPS